MRSTNRTKAVFYARIMIISAIALIFYSIFYELSSYDVEHSSAYVPIIEDDGKDISITPSDEDGSNVEIIDDEDVKHDDSSITQNNVNEDVNLSPIDYTNIKLKNEIQDTYGISVLYGSDTVGYSVSGISTVPISDSNTINIQLNNLKNSLSLYPKGLFFEIKKGGIPLTVYLINNFSDKNITGITDSSYTYAKISISAVHSFGESFYHESYHYIERYMFKKGANFNSWNSLNPSNFTYGNIYGDLSYSNTFNSNAPFVNNYAQTSDAEDRASTFEYMMAPSKASCLNNGNIVWQKASYMSRMIETVLSCVSPDTVEYWERYL